MILGARALGEFGDDPNRDSDAKSRKNYASTSPGPCAPSPTASSASCTAASATTPRTTNTPPGTTEPRSPLDSHQPWDV